MKEQLEERHEVELEERHEGQLEERLKGRLKELRAEFEQGQKMLVDLESRQESLKHSLLRISGAIQVLEEEIGKCKNKVVEVIPPSE